MLSSISLTMGKVKGLASTSDIYREHVFSSFRCIYPHKFMVVCKGLGRIGLGLLSDRESVPRPPELVHHPFLFCIHSLCPNWLSKICLLWRKLMLEATEAS